MKAQFKYAFISGLHIRGIVFAVILIINLFFIILGLLGLSPLPAMITGVALSGMGISVMTITNIISDIGIIRRLFAAPGAYVYALTPTHRGSTLLASVAAIAVMDIVSMTVVTTGVTWQGLMLAGRYVDIWGFIRNFHIFDGSYFAFITGVVLTTFAGYLLVLMFITACIVVKRSIFYQKSAGVLLTALCAIGALYVFSLSNFLLVPFGYVSRDLWFFTVSIDGSASIAYGILTLIQAFALFLVSAKLMERKLNI